MPKKTIIFGLHAVLSAISNDKNRVKNVFFDQSRKDRRLEEVIIAAQNSRIKTEAVNKQQLDKLCGGARHQSVACEYVTAKQRNEGELLDHLQSCAQPWLILILDGITDPHNLGACLRTADAAGVDAVIAPKDRAVGITPVVSKVAAGAVDHVPFFQITNLKRTIEKLQQRGLWVIGTSDKADAAYTDVDYCSPIAFVMGAEGQGMRRLTKTLCDQFVSLPMAGKISSLNVSVATGICLFEAIRQRALTD